MKNDYLIRATAANDFIRAFAVNCPGVAEEARKRHGTAPVVTAALGRTMAAALMMGVDLKHKDHRITLLYDCDGPIGGITVTADFAGHVKGFARNPQLVLPLKENGKLDVGAAIGRGQLHVMKDIGLKDSYNGSVAIQSGEVGEDLAYYFAVSEQIPSAVALGVLVDGEGAVLQTGGFLIQLLPGCPSEIAEELERTCQNLPQITTLLQKGETPETILAQVLGAWDLRVHDEMAVSFQCDCSAARVEKALIAMGKAELQSLIDEGEDVTLNCGFCNTDYRFTLTDLRRLASPTQVF